jgi:hypothetical protein
LLAAILYVLTIIAFAVIAGLVNGKDTHMKGDQKFGLAFMLCLVAVIVSNVVIIKTSLNSISPFWTAGFSFAVYWLFFGLTFWIVRIPTTPVTTQTRANDRSS